MQLVNEIVFDLQESLPDMVFFVCRILPDTVNIFFALSAVAEFDALNDSQRQKLCLSVVNRANSAIMRSPDIAKHKMHVKVFLVKEAAMCFSHFSTTNVDE